MNQHLSLTATIGGNEYTVGPDSHDLSIPLIFDGPQPNTYGVDHATSRPYEEDGWVGDTRRGGSCNFETYTLTPHCNGTHTECVGHITNDRQSIREVLRESLIPATLISVTPRSEVPDSYTPAINPKDKVITKADLEAALEDCQPAFLSALLIRTLPNAAEKKSQDYMQKAPAFFSHQAMEFLREKGVQHLLVDLPSVDRLFDEGKLSNHHIFWEMEQGSHDAPKPLPASTITEMIFVPDHVADGEYLLNLQIAPFHSDAAPSRPVLFELNQKWISKFD